MTTRRKRYTRDELAALLAVAANLLNDVDRDQWSNRQLGDFHTIMRAMPEHVGYANNGTVEAHDFDAHK